ncbi:hypothetical protein BD779DRAFT_1487804, partial [Infundibulicybe gibba]
MWELLTKPIVRGTLKLQTNPVGTHSTPCLGTTMKSVASLSLLLLARSVIGHGDHHSGPAEANNSDAFDIRSFFQLHDLNRDGMQNHGRNHICTLTPLKDDVEHQLKADHIVNRGRVTPEEFEKVGLDGLPNFDALGAEGHHYDIESEFFLHHEEKYHSTPETQTDESYNHPEDLEHFAHHEAIELKKPSERLVLQSHGEPVPGQKHEDATPIHQDAAQQITPEQPPQDPPSAPKPKVTRVTPPEKQAPEQKYRGAQFEPNAKGEWGTGERGYKPPRDPSDKMRKNLPYKYKFRRNWGDF